MTLKFQKPVPFADGFVLVCAALEVKEDLEPHREALLRSYTSRLAPLELILEYFLKFIILCLCMMHARGGQRRTLRSVLSFHTYVDPGDRTQVIRLVSTPPAEPSHYPTERYFQTTERYSF